MPRVTEGTFALGGLAALAIWLTVGLPFLYGPSSHLNEQKHVTAEQSGQSTNTKPDGSAAAPFVVQVIPGPKSPEERAQEAEEREEKKSADRWLVRWTAALFAATVGLILATGVLGYFGLQQSRDMKDSITAAKDSADIARTSLISTQRAYVRVAHFPWLWRSDFARPGKFFYDITPIIENNGNTQTVDAKINVNSALRDDPLPEAFDFPFVGTHAFTLIGANQSVGASNAIILDDDLLLVQDRKKFFYIWGTIDYRDVFPGTPDRVTEFCTQISRVMGDPLDPREAGNAKGTTVEIYFQIYPDHQKTT